VTPRDTLLTEMYERLQPVLYRKCLSMLKDDEAARDAAQEIFVKLSRSAENLRDTTAEEAWAVKAAHHHCLNVMRANGRRDAREDVTSPEDLVTRSPVTARQMGRAVLNRLSQQSQKVAVGRFVEGKELSELAEESGLSTRTVSRKLKGAVDKAHELLDSPKAKKSR
jgi:RNA polymerase sigma-70 factor (ECF subfamily)